MIIALITGALYRAPEQRTAKSGSKFVTATVRVKTGEAMQFVRIVMFSESGQAELLRLQDGDSLSIQGGLKAEVFEKNGEHRVSLSLVADQVLALRQPPKERKALAPEPPTKDTRSRQERCSGTWTPGGGPNDDLPFGDAR
jgi:single-stranded DNA-binding protein